MDPLLEAHRPINNGIGYFDGPPVVNCAAFAMHDDKLSEPADAVAHPFWDKLRNAVSEKAIDMYRLGFFGATMLPMSKLECNGIMEKLESLDEPF